MCGKCYCSGKHTEEGRFPETGRGGEGGWAFLRAAFAGDHTSITLPLSSSSSDQTSAFLSNRSAPPKSLPIGLKGVDGQLRLAILARGLWLRANSREGSEALPSSRVPRPSPSGLWRMRWWAGLSRDSAESQQPR